MGHRERSAAAQLGAKVTVHFVPVVLALALVVGVLVLALMGDDQ